MSAGKGDRARRVDKRRYDKNHDRVGWSSRRKLRVGEKDRRKEIEIGTD